ncbi:hypothetical protein NEF87_003241 [Candidatus Lokiarchaeum ossiferum]|uniref:VWFA domain-containing protein n=1 Tax=Candidatus Lokiarchaeum ossiferum TaxID=2951803 RepID=A0ABY6HU61_9ARCH|nr:hypothetical protein NEF87_003241 [Candidatus Lokiarchaeum sp. B-35]
MFKFSFGKVSRQVEKPEDFPLITALNFGELSTAKEIQDQPIICSFCNSILTNQSHLQKSGENFTYKCEFCLKENSVSHDQALHLLKDGIEPESTDVSSMEDMAFLLEEIRKEEDDALSKMKMEKTISGFPIQVAVIDVSGSMAGGKLEAVKHALVQNIHQLTADFPATKFVLIPFSSDVFIYPTPEKQIIVEDGPLFFKENKMEKEIARIVEKYPFQPIEKIYEGWTKIVKNMTDRSMTALGPGLFMGIQTIIASQKSQAKKTGGKVILLTDGLANVGLGSIENSLGKDSKDAGFYSNIAKRCLENNIIVDMVGVREQGGGNSVALDVIGKVTDYTGGQMLFITADQVESAFGSFHRTNYIARNVVMRIYSPEFLVLEEIQGAEVLQSLDKIKRGDPIKLGAFYPDREIYLKFQQKDTKLPVGTKIPVQIQLEYLDTQGNRKMRINRQEIEIAPDMENFKKAYSPKIATAFELSKASKLRSKGDIKFAEAQVHQTMARNVSLGGQYDMDISELNELVQDEMDEWKSEEAQAVEQKISDKKSFYAAMGQSRSRSSYNAKLKRMRKKKK